MNVTEGVGKKKCVASISHKLKSLNVSSEIRINASSPYFTAFLFQKSILNLILLTIHVKSD
jgi:hypothetical protein